MTPFAIRRSKLPEVFGSEQLVRKLIAEGTLKPLQGASKNLALFDFGDCARAYEQWKRQTTK